MAETRTLSKAELTLQLALQAVKDGTAKHGDTQASFEMIAQMWQLYIEHAWRKTEFNYRITAHDVAMMMAMVKMARAVYSHEYHADNYVDLAGYAALSSMLESNTNIKGAPTDDSVRR